METVSRIADVQRILADRRVAGRRIVFVPTMGHLHGGHQGLVARALELGDFVLASIFVNPAQFGEGEDYSSYPRTLEPDREKLAQAGCHLLFTPEVSELYPHGSESSTFVEVPELGKILCGRHRPGHFRGVATVVNILFNLLRPDVAVFGEKDYQQLLVVRRMVRELHLPVEVASAPTAREADGLAMSSRNAYLDSVERAAAPLLYRTLCGARDAILGGERNYIRIEERSMQRLGESGFRPEYFSVRRAQDLAAAGQGDTALALLGAAWLGRARLIDNLRINLPA